MDGSCEQKEVSSPKLLEPNSIYSDAKEVKITGISPVSILKSNSDAPLPVEPVIPSDVVATDGSPTRGMTQDVQGNYIFYLFIKRFSWMQLKLESDTLILSLVHLVCLGVKVFVLNKTVKFHPSQDACNANLIPAQKGTSSTQFSSEFIKSDEKEARISAGSIITKSDSKVDNMPLAESDIGENIPLDNTTKPQTSPMEQPLSYVESSVASQSEVQSMADKSITHEEATTVERSLLNHDSFVKGRDKPDVSEASHKDEETTFGISGNFVITQSGHLFNLILSSTCGEAVYDILLPSFSVS